MLFNLEGVTCFHSPQNYVNPTANRVVSVSVLRMRGLHKAGKVLDLNSQTRARSNQQHQVHHPSGMCVESVVFRRNHHFLIRWCTTHTLFTDNKNLYKSIKDPLIQYIVYLQALVETIFTWWVLIASDTFVPLKCFLMNLQEVPTNQMGLWTAYQRSLNGRMPKKNTSLPWEFLLNSLTIAQESSSSLAGLLHPVLKWQYNSILRFPMMLVKMSWLLIQCV